MTSIYRKPHSRETLYRRCIMLAARMQRAGLRPAWIEPRVDKQAEREIRHNEQQTLRARARRRHAKKHDQLCQQAKDFKLAYDACGRHPTFHAEAKPHPLIVALRQTTL